MSVVIEKELTALRDEAMRQFTGINTQGRRLYRRSIEQSEVVVSTATNQYNTMMVDIETQYAALLKELTAQYKTIVTQTMTQYRMLMQTTQKIYETATIGEIVAYVEKQGLKIQNDFELIQKKFVEEVSAFVEEYKKVITNMDINQQIKLVTEKMQAFAEEYIKMMEPYYKEFQKFLKVYQAKVMAQYKKITDITDKMMDDFQKMSAKAVAQYKTLSAMAVVKYEKFVAEMKAKYEQLTVELTLKYKSLRGDIETIFNEIKQRLEVARSVFVKRVAIIEASLKMRLNTMKKMTVQQTVDVLLKVPADLQVLTTMPIKEVTATLKKMQKA